jgi:hypothetical protein
VQRHGSGWLAGGLAGGLALALLWLEPVGEERESEDANPIYWVA